MQLKLEVLVTFAASLEFLFSVLFPNTTRMSNDSLLLPLLFCAFPAVASLLRGSPQLGLSLYCSPLRAFPQTKPPSAAPHHWLPEVRIYFLLGLAGGLLVIVLGKSVIETTKELHCGRGIVQEYERGMALESSSFNPWQCPLRLSSRQ